MTSKSNLFDLAGFTDVGVKRENNEDAFGIWASKVRVERQENLAYGTGKENGPLLLVVADGMGGAEAGELASQYAVEQSISFWKERFAGKIVLGSDFLLGLWRTLLDEMQASLRERALDEPTKGMATTYTGLLVVGDRGYWAQCGDSRLYRLRKGNLKILTSDQSPVGKLFQMGEITEAQARKHPYKNLLDQCLGGDDDEPFLPEFGAIDLENGDCFLLCSDGVMDGLWDEEIAEHLEASQKLGARAAVEALIEQAKMQSGKDNLTGILLHLRKKTGEPGDYLGRLRSLLPTFSIFSKEKPDNSLGK